MKLRVFTDGETIRLIKDIELICKYIVDVNTDAVVLFNNKYQEYLDAFDPGLIFKRKPLTFEKFCKKCFWNEGGTKLRLYDPSEDYRAESKFFEDHFKVAFKYCNFEAKLRFFDDHFTKYGVTGWTQEDTKVFNAASLKIDYYFSRYTFREWYAILVKYAHKPFEFDAEDIKILEYIEHDAARAREYYKGKPNETFNLDEYS